MRSVYHKFSTRVGRVASVTLLAAAFVAACSAENAPSARPAILQNADALTAAAANSTLDRNRLAREYFGHVNGAYPGQAQSIGSYARGCFAGGQQLAETGPSWQAMRLSRNRNWAHPNMINFVRRLSQKAQTEAGWAGLYVGDMSQPRGGQCCQGTHPTKLALMLISGCIRPHG